VVPRNVVSLATLTHGSGAISQVQGVWGPPGMRFRTSFSISGDAGGLRYSSAAPLTISENLASVEGFADYLPPATAQESPYLTELREICAAFTGGPAPRVTAADGVLAVALCAAARESIMTGRPVPFDAASVVAAGP
jgi:predicted dehydrogenase